MAEFIVTLSEDADAARTCDALQRAGFAVDQVLAELSMIVGHADPIVAGGLRKLPGVLAVEPSGAVHVGPPDAPLH